MKIFSILSKNLRVRPITLRFPGEVPYPKEFRGPVKIQTEKCIGCGMCAYVCVSGAIRVIDHEDHCEWAYSPGRCTFCGQCAAVCPVQALRMEDWSAPSYFRAEALDEMYRVPYPVCPECGRPTPPIREALLAQIFKEVTPEVLARSQLCRRCRQRASQRGLVSIPKQ
jgi:formate hydrogenlyase subunit 6/NADH:ubiquinone oxidoreductase subunit I